MNLGYLTLHLIGGGEGSLAMYLKQIAAGAAMVGALGFSAVGLGAGIASAAPPAPVVAGSSVAARSRPWGRLGPWRRSRLGRPWRLGLRWKLGLRARVGLCHRSVWARHLVPLVADRFGR